MPDMEHGMKADPSQWSAREEIKRAIEGTEDNPRLPDTPIFDLLARANSIRREVNSTQAQAPEDTPDITRTAQMLDGVIQSVERAAAELVARLAPVLTDIDVPTSVAFDRDLHPASTHGQALWSFCLRLSAVESVLVVTESRLAV